MNLTIVASWESKTRIDVAGHQTGAVAMPEDMLYDIPICKLSTSRTAQLQGGSPRRTHLSPSSCS
jgi:hypothetical protein